MTGTRLTDGGRFPMRSDPGRIRHLHWTSWQTLRPLFAYETWRTRAHKQGQSKQNSDDRIMIMPREFERGGVRSKG